MRRSLTRRKQSTIQMQWAYEICKVCGRQQRTAWAVSDDVWNKVTNRYKKVLCLECFLKKASEKQIEIKREDFVFFDWLTESRFYKILQKDESDWCAQAGGSWITSNGRKICVGITDTDKIPGDAKDFYDESGKPKAFKEKPGKGHEWKAETEGRWKDYETLETEDFTVHLDPDEVTSVEAEIVLDHIKDIPPIMPEETSILVRGTSEEGYFAQLTMDDPDKPVVQVYLNNMKEEWGIEDKFKRQMDITIRHEMGHTIPDRTTNEEWSTWEKLWSKMKAENTLPTEKSAKEIIAAQNSNEGMAECFAYYALDEKEKLAPEAGNFLNKLIERLTKK